MIYVDLTPHPAREASALLWLDPEEKSRWQRFPYAGPRRRFTLCRAALRAILCDLLDCENQRLSFGESYYGKPFARIDDAPADVSFNVSHSGIHGLIGVAGNGRLGVDVEEMVIREYDYIESIADWAFTECERIELASRHGSCRTELFLRMWTIKEALIKAIGMGLSFDMSSFSTPLGLVNGTASLFNHPRLPSVTWRVEYLGNDHFVAAIAHEVESRPGQDRETTTG